MIRKIAALAAIGVAIGLGGAQAQNWDLDPTYGTAKLSAGFATYSVEVQAGGSMNAADTIGNGCNGYVADAPDLRVFLTAGALPLVISVQSTADTTLAVNDPNGEWICNDDYTDLNPRVTFAQPVSGQYDIWVGTYSSDGGFPAATLTVAESTEPVALDWSLPPNFGTFDLASGFTPDPFVLDVVAGGEVDASATAQDCRGFASAAPDIRITFTAGNYPLYLSVLSDADTTLIVNDPSGNWICDDDSGGSLNPQIVLDSPQSGQYDIWVGVYGGGGTAEATFYASEIGGPTSGELNWDLPANYGEIALTGGFTPDPYVVELAAGGDIDASNVGVGCWGYVTSAPDFRVQFSDPAGPLTFYVEAQADTTLIIADPDGNWACNDDTNGLNPSVTFDVPLEGQYDVWVGTYSLGDNPPATLYITDEGGGAKPGEQTIDWALPPTFGEIDLAAGFTPDPFSVDVTAGGTLDAATADAACVGMVTAAPTYRLYYGAGAYPLYIWVEANADTTLVISDPDGNWICDDDGAAVFLSPALGWDHPTSGQYDIWVGTYGAGTAPATLKISETIDGRASGDIPPSLPPMPSLPPPSVPPPPASGPVFVDVAAMDWTLPPTTAEIALDAGFSPDPTAIDVQAGGELAAGDTAGLACVGFVSAAPTVRLTYSAGAWPLVLSAMSEADTTLVVRTPSGEWICNDDANDLNPSIRFETPESGQYDIWVGTFDTDLQQAATLLISELGTP